MAESSTTMRALHNLGLATWFGGTLFGQVALNPTVSSISDKRERGRVVNEAWIRFNAVNAVAVAAAIGAWRFGGLKEAEEELGLGAGALVGLKDVLLGAALFNSAVSGVLGARIAGQSPEGDTPVESGTEPAPETPEAAARSQRLIWFFGAGSLVSLAAAATVSAALETRANRMGALGRLLS